MVETRYGSITISDEVVAELSARAAVESYGVVGLARRGMRANLVELLSRTSYRRGVQVKREGEDAVALTLYVVVEYGTNLVEVVRNLVERIRYDVESRTGLDVTRIDVIVKGVAGR